jgi:fusaric acid resistance family protein
VSAVAAGLLRAALTTAAVLGALGTVLALEQVVALPPQIAVLAAVLTLTLARVPVGRGRSLAEAAVGLPVVALAAGGAGWLVVHLPWLGQSLLVAGLSAGILARRFGPLARRGGRLVALPFLALLVTPAVAVAGSGGGSVLWAAAAALVAVLWTALPAPLSRRLPDTRPQVEQPQPRRSGRRVDVPTRMAAQMVAGLSGALVVGHLLFGDRWAWTLLSAFLVASGNRGRGDVVHKAGLRLLGAGLGTAAATLATGWTAPGNRLVLVALFAVMAVALALRPYGYGFWAAGVTAMVALLHAYYGDAGTALLGERLLGVVVGSLVAVVVAWWILPLRTADVLRRRIADCLAALTDDLGDEPGRGARYPAAVVRLEQLAPTLRAHALAGRALGRPGPHPAHAVAALRGLTELPDDAGERRALRTATVRVRRAMVGKDDPPVAELPAPLATVHQVLKRAAGATRR